MEWSLGSARDEQADAALPSVETMQHVLADIFKAFGAIAAVRGRPYLDPDAVPVDEAEVQALVQVFEERVAWLANAIAQRQRRQALVQRLIELERSIAQRTKMCDEAETHLKAARDVLAIVSESL